MSDRDATSEKLSEDSPFNAARRAVREVAGPPRILIVRLTALGDVIHGMPVACALRDAFPEAILGWVVEGGAGDLVEGHPAIDHLIRVPRKWLKSPRAILDLRSQLRKLRFDIAVDLQCLTKSALVALLSGAPRRLGAAGCDGRELSKWFNNELTISRATHVVDHYLGILEPLGIRHPQVRFDLPERAEDAAFAEQLIDSVGLTQRQFAVLNPGAGWPSKLWPVQRYGEVARHLADRWGLASLAVWGGDELPLAEQIASTGAGNVRVAPATTLRQLSAVLRRSRLFIGSDTGPMHLAVAVETPAISLHGTSRAWWCGAYGPTNQRLQAYYQDGSARARRGATNAAMCAITVADVLAACGRILDSPAQPVAGRCA